jgi:ribosomal protein S12 methylthiotransferase
LKIAEGCAKRCSYCSIPHIKGPLKSKPSDQVLKEFQYLLDQGVFEMILIAQDLGDYGKDFAEKTSLKDLIKEILKIKKNFWLRLLYLYPDEIDASLIDLISSDRRICPYIDMPIQHVNDQILKSMHRATNKQKIISIIENLRKKIPNIVIRTSLMVGYPGETEEQFLELCEFVKSFQLDHVGVFAYSKEDNTRAAKLAGQISQEIKEKRKKILTDLQFSVCEKKNRLTIGQKIAVFIEGYHPESDLLMVGRSYAQSPEIDNQVIINNTQSVDSFYEPYFVEITDVAGYDLVGKVLHRLDRKNCIL